MAKERWRIERDCQDLKQKIGFGDYEGRGWRCIHYHATLCIAAYGFLISEKETIPPRDLAGSANAKRLAYPEVTDPEAPPIRPERHVANSIPTLRRRLAVELARRLLRYPYCSRVRNTLDNQTEL